MDRLVFAGWSVLAKRKSQFSTALFLIFLSVGCTTPPDLGKIDYAIQNTSSISVGYKVHLKKGANASLARDSSILAPGAEAVIIKSHALQEPNLIVDSVEIWNTQFKVKYKTLKLSEYTNENNGYSWLLTMPDKNSSPIIKLNHPTPVFINETMLFGYYPKVDYPRETYFFYTPDYFTTFFKTQTPVSRPTADFEQLQVFGNTIIGWDGNNYSDKTLFIKSTSSGAQWSTLFEFGFSTSNDAFMGAHFVSEDSGWLFNYTRIFTPQFQNTYATDVYRYNSGNIVKISSISDFCVQVCKFIDDKNGYVLLNASDNIVPASSRYTYIRKTTDGGVTWSAPILISDEDLGSKLYRLNNGKLIVFLDPSLLFVNYYYVSTDDGQTWKKEIVATPKGIRDIHFLGSGVGYLKTGVNGQGYAQNMGDVYKTTDGGATWAKQTEKISGSKIYFYNDNIGYLQDLIYNSGQVLYVTKDGGNTWREVLYPYDYLIR